MPETIKFLLDGNRGMYVPQGFAECYDREVWHYSEDDAKILLSGPDHEYYWEAWEAVLNEAYLTDEDGHTWTIYQDCDLFVCREDHVFDED